jgi:hypothetical protein
MSTCSGEELDKAEDMEYGHRELWREESSDVEENHMSKDHRTIYAGCNRMREKYKWRSFTCLNKDIGTETKT